VSITPLEEIRNARLQKTIELRELGINPFPSRSARSHSIQPLRDQFSEYEGQTVTIAGRLMSWRKHGALRFGHVQDQTGTIQLYIRRDQLAATDAESGHLGYADLRLVDIGDIVEATGTVTRTERGEISVLLDSLRLLSKSLRPLPEKWSGLKDREIILRKRYLDAIVNPETKARFEQIARMLFEVRRFFNDRGFLEFQTPVVQPQYGGGTAKPFTTRVNALDCEQYLAISHELYLKRLIIAGYDKVYTIGRYFRNEGIDRTHQPEFSMIETMTAYENYEYNMNLIEELFRHIAINVFGKTTFQVRGHEVDFGQPWTRIAMADAVQRETGIDFRECSSVEQANAQLAALHLPSGNATIGDALAVAFEEAAAPKLIQPTLVYGHPVEISPLAKPMDHDPRYAERFEIFIGGMECGDNWSEQNDPVTLLERWRSQFQERHTYEGETEYHPLDYDFIEALEYGMAPTTGIGPGIERMAMIFTEQENIDDVIFFPMMKPVTSEANRRIYGIRQPEGARGREQGATSE
jgi:lysyl-tRNA synthetase class 2